MSAKIIVVGGEKGGTGKSTTAIQFAIMLTLMNKDVIVVDADKQRSIAKFFDRRNGENIHPLLSCVSILGKHLNSEIERLANRFEYIIVDVGGRDSVELRSALVAKGVNLWLSPLQPTDLDMDTLETLNELAAISSTYNPDLTTKIILNSCPTHSKIKTVDEAKDIIKESFEFLDVCNTTLGHRVAYQYSVSNQLSVVEFEHQEYKKLPSYRAKSFLHKASNEITDLYNEVIDEPFVPLIQSKENVGVAEEIV